MPEKSRSYKTTGKCEDQQNYKAMIEASLVSTSEGCTKNTLMAPNPHVSTKKPSAIKLLHQFTETLDFRHKTAVQRFGAVKAKRNTIKNGMTWSNISKRRGCTEISPKVRDLPYHWILHHPQVMQSPIGNDCLYVSIHGKSEKQLMTKLLLQVYLRELHNIMVSPPEEGGLK